MGIVVLPGFKARGKNIMFRSKKDIEKIASLELIIVDLQATIKEKSENIDCFIEILQEEKQKADQLKGKQFSLKSPNNAKIYHFSELKVKLGELQNRILDNYYKD